MADLALARRRCRKENGLACPDSKEKHPEKETEHHHPDTGNIGQAELKTVFFSGSLFSDCFLFFTGCCFFCRGHLRE